MSRKLIVSASVLALLAAAPVTLSTQALAQSEAAAPGTVIGAVTVQGENGRSGLEGAIIRLSPGGRETTAGPGGRFRIDNLPAGDYTATVTYFGAEPFEISFTVEPGETTNVEMSPSADDVVVVVGTRAAANAARARERANDRFSSIVASDAIGQFGDQNVAESLQRLPAVNIFRSEGEGRFASIRGLPPGFGQVTFDGSVIASGGSDQRSFALDVIPSDLLDSIEVTKTLTPDLDANSISGRIDIQSLSAFRRGRNSAQFRAEGSYQPFSGRMSPKVSGNATYLMDVGGGSENFGIAVSGSWFKRDIDVNELRNDNSPNSFANNDDFLILDEVDQRREVGVRTRWGGATTLEYKASENDFYQLYGKYTRLTDDDTSIRSIWDLDNATGNEVLAEDRNFFVLSDVDLERQVLFQKSEQNTLAVNFKGENVRDAWTFSYGVDYSWANFDKPGLQRARFQEENEVVVVNFGEDFANVFPIANDQAAQYGVDPDDIDNGDSNGDFTNLSNFRLDDVFLEDSFRTDELYSANFDVTRDFTYDEMPGFVKFGAKVVHRSRDRDKDRITWQPTNSGQRNRVCDANPGIADCNSALQFTQDDFTQINVDGPAGSFGSLAALSEQREVLNFLDDFADTARAGETILESRRDDYNLDERVYAGYVMGQLDVTPSLRVIGGVRVERTELETTGYLSLENDDFVFPGDVTTNDIVDFLGTAEKDYTDFFPSLHARWEPSEDIVIRASYTTGTARPDFNASRNRILIDNDISLQDASGEEYGDTDDLLDAIDDGTLLLPLTLASDVELDLGNPNLDAAYANNFDASIAWYPTPATYFSFAGFYKRINDFLFDARLTDVTFAGSGTGLVFPSDDIRVQVLDAAVAGQDVFFEITQDQVFDRIDVTLNGDLGTVQGFEFAFAHSFEDMLEGWANGFFVAGNLTYTDSMGDYGGVTDRELELPGISKWTANLSGGYENEFMTLRTSANYRSSRLGTVDGDSVGTGRQSDYLSVDLNARANVTDHIQLYFDGINLNNAKDEQTFDGNAVTGRLLRRVEEFGRTYQFGVRINY